MTENESATVTPLDRGSASLRIDLSEGVVTVRHGDHPTEILFQAPVHLGTWDAMWDAIRMGEVK